MNYFIDKINDYLLKRKRLKYLKDIQNLSVTPNKDESNKEYVTFSHIGLIGDIIYSIPAMLAIAKEKKIRLYLDINQKSMYSKNMNHYNSDKILTENSIAFISPLLLSNNKFDVCKKLETEKIDYDLNEFRKYPFDYRMGHICRWYFLAFGITYDITKPWLKVKPNNNYANSIIIARSFRYRAPGIDYNFLSKYDNISFIGLKDEYEDFKTIVPSATYLITNNALELAEIISGCKFFIGNQSFPFSVAEALKVKRVLEVCPDSPNVIVDGENGYDFCFQLQFEKIIKEINL